MNRKIGNRITSFVLVLLMVCSTVLNTGLTAFAETSDGNAPMESVDFTDGSDIGADTVDNTVTNPADETSATLVDSETAAALSAVKVLTYATDEENITDTYLGIALTGETAFEEGSTLSCHVMDDQERASYTESLQSELDSDETKTRQVSIVKAFDLGVLTSNHSVQKTFDASMTVRMYLQNADALSDTALYVHDENQAWHEVPFEVYESSNGRDGRDEAESKVAHDLPYIQCSANQLGTFAFAEVSETDISADESGTAQEPVDEAETYAYADARASNPVNNVYWWYDGSKTTLHLSNKAETNAYQLFTSGQPWSGYNGYNSGKITQVVLDTEIQPTSTASWFYGCKALTNLDFGDKLNTVDVTDMHQMFEFCENLKSLNLGSKFDTSHVTNMGDMFYECSSLISLDLGDKFNTGSVTNMESMFNYCRSLTSLDLGDKFDTGSVTSMYFMFDGCLSLTSLDLGDKFDTGSVSNMEFMFDSCRSLTSLDLGDKFNTGSVTNMDHMFEDCRSLTSLDLGDKFDTGNVTNMDFMFDGCRSLISLDLGDKFNTGSVTTMSSMFSGCSSLKELNLGSRFDTSHVEYMDCMFAECSSLTSLNLGDKFNTGSVTDMGAMFYNCSGLTSLDLGNNFDTGSVSNMEFMFYNCSSLTSLDLGDKFNTGNVRDATGVADMFKGCDALQKLVSQKAGRQDIELPLKMIEQDSPDGVVYSVMPSGSKILVPFAFSVAESITSTTVVMRKSMDKSFENVPIFEFGVYREDGTLVDTVKNDRDGNIVIETKDYALGRYYVQEKAGTGANIIYDTSKYYFTVSEVQEKVTGVHVSHDGNYMTYYTLIKPSLLTGSNLRLSGFSWITVRDSEGNPHTLRSYCTNLSKHVPHGTAKQVYINPTDAEINEARGDVYTGPQKNLSDAIRCILYFENENAQQRIWDLFNRGAVIDTSRVNEIPAEFQFAIITPPSFDMQPLIVPLADIRVEDKGVMEEITTGIVKKRVVTLETPVSVFENRTSSKTYVIKQDEDGNVLYGAKLSLWKDGELVRSFTTTAATFGEVLADGDYILREDEAPDGYEKAADISFQVKDHVAYQNGVAVSENTIVMIDKAVRRLTTLTVSKKVTGSFGDKYKDFKFYLTLDDDSITSLSYTKGDATETVTRNADNQFEFTLSHGESVVFADLPVGTGYTVTEPDAKAEGYEVTADGATGTIQENGSTVLFTNHRNMVVSTELDTNMAVFGMILAAGCVLLIGYWLKCRKK